jgi:hypothetical protein
MHLSITIYYADFRRSTVPQLHDIAWLHPLHGHIHYTVHSSLAIPVQVKLYDIY